MQIAGYILMSLIFAYLFLGIVFLLILSIAGLVRKRSRYLHVSEKRRIALIIPAYKEDNVILETAARAAAHNYGTGEFKVFVIADKLREETIGKLKSIPVNVTRVDFISSTKAKSLQACLQSIDGSAYDIAMILDADNIMEDGCLDKVNSAFDKGYQAVQCHRTAKNKQTPVAFLDAVSEEINNHLFRKGPRALGLSAALIGSGMAFRFTNIRDIFNLPHILDNPGEDREVDMQLMKENIIVEYIDDAIVLDEKVSSSQVFEKQRVRWLEAQLTHFKRFLSSDMKEASRNLNFYSKFIQTIILPRSLYIVALAFFTLLMMVGTLLSLPILPPLLWWIVMDCMFAFSLLFAIPGKLYNRQMLSAILHLPALILSMIKALLKIKRKRTEFLHTPKTYTS